MPAQAGRTGRLVIGVSPSAALLRLAAAPTLAVDTTAAGGDTPLVSLSDDDVDD